MLEDCPPPVRDHASTMPKFIGSPRNVRRVPPVDSRSRSHANFVGNLRNGRGVPLVDFQASRSFASLTCRARCRSFSIKDAAKPPWKPLDEGTPSMTPGQGLYASELQQRAVEESRTLARICRVWNRRTSKISSGYAETNAKCCK